MAHVTHGVKTAMCRSLHLADATARIETSRRERRLVSDYTWGAVDLNDPVAPLAARTEPMSSMPPPHHMLNLVTIDGGQLSASKGSTGECQRDATVSMSMQ